MRIRCPACRRSDQLRGERLTDAIKITCGSCGHVWRRTEDTCPECGQETLTIGMRVPIIQKARGAQQSIIGYREVKECTSCGYQSGDPTPPENYTREAQ